MLLILMFFDHIELIFSFIVIYVCFKFTWGSLSLLHRAFTVSARPLSLPGSSSEMKLFISMDSSFCNISNTCCMKQVL